MTKAQIVAQIVKKKSFLCVGLDTDYEKIKHLGLGRGAEAIVAFNKKIIEATADFAVAYKINTAFYEALGAEGWLAMEQTCKLLPPDTFRIADAKRADIGNTATQYAKAFFENIDFDAITLSPYMGADSILPFLDYPDKFAIVLALTSNPSAAELQMLKVENNSENKLSHDAQTQYLYQALIQQSFEWGNEQNIMFVAGATRPEGLAAIRKRAPNHFLLVPGLGIQGGSLAQITNAGQNHEIGLLVNASRNIIYAGNTASNFQSEAAKQAANIANEMRQFVDKI